MPRELRQELVEFSERLFNLASNHPAIRTGGKTSGMQRRIVEEFDKRWPEDRKKSVRGKPTTTAHVVSMASVSKWFKGQSKPEPENIDRLAELLDTTPEFLEFGETGPNHFKPQRVTPIVRDKAAAMIFGNFAKLEGGDYGFPRENDPRFHHVDLTITLNQDSVDVRMLTAEILGPGYWSVMIPSSWRQAEIVVAFHIDRYRLEFIHLPKSFLERATFRRGRTPNDLKFLKIGDAEYQAPNGDRLPVMQDFESLYE